MDSRPFCRVGLFHLFSLFFSSDGGFLFSFLFFIVFFFFLDRPSTLLMTSVFPLEVKNKNSIDAYHDILEIPNWNKKKRICLKLPQVDFFYREKSFIFLQLI